MHHSDCIRASRAKKIIQVAAPEKSIDVMMMIINNNKIAKQRRIMRSKLVNENAGHSVYVCLSVYLRRKI